MMILRKCLKKLFITPTRCCTTRFRVGDEITVTKKIHQKDVDQFAKLTGDTNPIHSTDLPENKRLVHGALLNGLVSGVIGTRLPGPGAIVLSQQISFPKKCSVGKDVVICVKLAENRKIMKVAFECRQDNEVVLEGHAKLIMFNKVNI